MTARLRLAVRLLRCVLLHDVRQRQGAYRCWRCAPPKHKPEPLLEEIREEIKRGAAA